MLVDGGASFTASIPRSKTNSKEDGSDFSISCTANPGELTTLEEFDVWGLNRLSRAVAEWANRIAQDLQRSPAMRAIAQEAAKLRAFEERLESLPEEPSPEYVERIQTALSDLESQLRQKIEELELGAKEKQARLDKLALEFAFLKDRLEGSSVKQALRTMFTRLQKLASDPQTGLLLENGQKLLQLAAGMSEHLPKI